MSLQFRIAQNASAVCTQARVHGPLATSSECDDILRTLFRNNVTLNARRVRDLRLVLEEDIVRGVHGILDVSDLAAREKTRPRVATRVLFAALRDHQQRIQAVEKLGFGSAIVLSRICGVAGSRCEPVVHLLRIGVHVVEFPLARAPRTVEEAVVIAHQSQGLVGVVVVFILLETDWGRVARVPELYVDKLRLVR